MSEQIPHYLPVGLKIVDDFESSSLLWFGYDPDTSLFYAGFKPNKELEAGAVYEYNNVPENIFYDLISAKDAGESVGKAFNELIKKSGYTYQRIDQPVEEEEVKVTEPRARVLRGVPVGMLWFDNSKELSIEDRAQRAIDFYVEKYGASYSQHFLVAVHPDMIPDEFKPEGEFDAIDTLSSFTFYADQMVSPDYFLVSEAKI